MTQFSFTGGEALLKDGCLELMDFASKRAQAGLLSNGRAMTEDVLRFCAERGIHVMMSMPGLTSFAANTDSDTSVEQLYETISAALVAGADSLLLNRFLPGGRGLSHPELMLTAEEVRQIADVAEEVLSRAKRHGHFGTELPDCMIDAGKYEYLNVTTGCSAATDFFTVGPNGMLRVCNHSPVELVKWDEWEKLPECEEWMHYVRHDYLPKMCDGCDKAAKCLGGCREAARVFSGSPTAPDPLMAG